MDTFAFGPIGLSKFVQNWLPTLSIFYSVSLAPSLSEIDLGKIIDWLLTTTF